MANLVEEHTVQRPIYLDYAATTPVDAQVVEKMTKFLSIDGVFGNPASNSHPYGWQALKAVDDAREQVANAIGADPREIVWTSGATEANNLAIKGIACRYHGVGKHIITMQTEHKAVLDTVKFLEKKGFEVTCLKPQTNGLLDLNDLKNALRDDTILVSIMYVNNETGVVQDIEAIAKMLHPLKTFLHVDAVQALGKLPIDLAQTPIDLLSITAHKIYGPKGIGALYVRRESKVNLQAMIHGGGHERGMRSGTLPTHQIIGFGEAVAIADKKIDHEPAEIERLRDRLWNGIKDIPGIRLNGESVPRCCGILNVSFANVDGDNLIKSLPQLAVAQGSACDSAVIEPSHVLQAMGVSDELAHSTIRFSLGRYTTEQEIEKTISVLQEKIPH